MGIGGIALGCCEEWIWPWVDELGRKVPSGHKNAWLCLGICILILERAEVAVPQGAVCYSEGG